MQHAALCLSGSADVSVQLTPYAAYRDSGAKPRVWSSHEGLKLGSYGDYIALNKLLCVVARSWQLAIVGRMQADAEAPSACSSVSLRLRVSTGREPCVVLPRLVIQTRSYLLSCHEATTGGADTRHAETTQHWVERPLSETLQLLFGLECAAAANLIESGAVYLEQRRATAITAPVPPGSHLRVHLQPKQHAVPEKLTIVACAEEYVVCSKPSGVPVHPTVDSLQQNLLWAAAAQLRMRLLPTSRLDEGTSGLVLRARHAMEAAASMRTRRPTLRVATDSSDPRYLTAGAPCTHGAAAGALQRAAAAARGHQGVRRARAALSAPAVPAVTIIPAAAAAATIPAAAAASRRASVCGLASSYASCAVCAACAACAACGAARGLHASALDGEAAARTHAAQRDLHRRCVPALRRLASVLWPRLATPHQASSIAALPPDAAMVPDYGRLGAVRERGASRAVHAGTAARSPQRGRR